MQVVVPAAASFILCVLAMLALRPVAVVVDLVDKPGGRKTHHGEVPIVGGLAMLLGMILGLGLLPLPANTAAAFLAGCALLVTIGIIDDRFDLSPWMRIPGQVAAASILMVGSGVMVTTLGDPFGAGAIHFGGISSIVFTIVITIAAINAFNMLDGMDGLAGTTALTAVLASAYLAASAGRPRLAAASLVIAGAISAFLLFNVPTRLNRVVRCFMGDAGSTLLGFSVAWLCIELTQGPKRVIAPVTTWWIVALPLFELVWTTLRRLIRGVSPFRADTNHFHHLLLKAGLTVRGAFIVFVVAAVLLATLGIVIERADVPDVYSFLMLIAVGVGTVFLMYRPRMLWQLFSEPLPRPQQPERAAEE